jgi:hypothetical protein
MRVLNLLTFLTIAASIQIANPSRAAAQAAAPPAAPVAAPPVTTTTTTTPTTTVGTCTNGLPGKTYLGMFVGNSPDPSVQSWLGRLPDFWTEFVGNGSWSDDSPGWSLSQFPEPSSEVRHISMPLIPGQDVPDTYATLEQAAAGDYNNYYLQEARTLASVSPSAIIRVGYEFNGNWMPWNAQADPAAFVGAWRQFVTAFRSVSPSFQFDWTTSQGAEGMDPELAYPGDAYVDYIGMDVYDNSQFTSGDCESRWNSILTEPYGLNWQVQFAAEHGNKPLSYPEWGSNYNDGCLINHMATWFQTHDVAYQAYWNSDSAFPNGSLDEDPVNKAAYIKAFGGPDGTTGCGATGDSCSASPIAALATPAVSLDGIDEILTAAQSVQTQVDEQATGFTGTPAQMATVQTAVTGLNSDIQALQNLKAAVQGEPANPSQDAIASLQNQLTNVLTEIGTDSQAVNTAIAALDPTKDQCLITLLTNFYTPWMPVLAQAGSDQPSTLEALFGNILNALGVTDTDYDQTAMDDPAHVAALDESINGNYILGLKYMTEQLTTTMMQQILIIGTFMDAQNQLEAQRLMQDMDAQADKEYEPSTQMCIIGTNVRSLAMSDQKGKANTYILSNAMLSRSMLPISQEGGEGKNDDMVSRISQYEKKYCNPNDNDQLMGNMGAEQFFCGKNGAPQARRNRDIDFTGLVDGPLTLDVDFTDNTLTDDEEDVLAMSRNLFSSTLVDSMPPDFLTEGPQTNMGPGAWMFQNWRSLEAIRGVAENSFAHLVGMKAKGGAQVYPFMSQVMQSMNMPQADIQNFLSPVAVDGTNPAENQNPSYFAQMDVLTKRIYMSPDFYVNLFTQPTNVERLGVTLQAIKLMNDRDRFESSLRREMLISLIVEMKLREQERDVDNNLVGNLPALFVQ